VQYLSDYTGTVYEYRSTLRPVASIGYGNIPHLLTEPGSDPDGTRRTFRTSAQLDPDWCRHLGIWFLAEYPKNP
jgi:hypothetical protein